jgi:hypothetical protein
MTKKTKSKFISVNVSTTSMIKSRCSHCGSTEKLYTCFDTKSSTKIVYRNPEYSPNRSDLGFPDERPVIDVTHKLNSLSYSSAYHRNFKTKSNSRLKRIHEVLYCDNCMKSKIVIQEKSANKSLSTVNRRGKYSYPSKIED